MIVRLVTMMKIIQAKGSQIGLKEASRVLSENLPNDKIIIKTWLTKATCEIGLAPSYELIQRTILR